MPIPTLDSSNECWKFAMTATSENIEKSDLPVAPHCLLKLPFKRFSAAAVLILVLICTSQQALAHGFNANHVDIVKTFGRKYRVIIRYTHVEAGEYREAHIDFDKKEEAIKAFQDLAKGADFFLGDIRKSIHFHTPPESNTPY
jgi:hypothetical protein